MDPAAALAALLQNALRFQPEPPERRRQTLQTYLELAATVPVSRVSYQRRFELLPSLLDELERQLAGPS